MYMRDRNTRQYQLGLSPQARVMKSWERRESRNPITGQYRGDHEPTPLDAVADQYETYARHMNPSHSHKKPSTPKNRPQTAKPRSKRKVDITPTRRERKVQYKPQPEILSPPTPNSARSSVRSSASSAPSESYFHTPNSPLSRVLYRVHQYSDATKQEGNESKPYNAFLTDPIARDRNCKTRERIEWVSKYKEQIDSHVDHEDRKYRQRRHVEKVNRQEALRAELDKQASTKKKINNHGSEDIVFGRDDLKRRDEWRRRSQSLRQDQLDLIATRKAKEQQDKCNENGYAEQPIFVTRQQQVQSTSRQLAQQLRDDNLALMKLREEKRRKDSKPVYYKSSLFY